MKYRLTLEIDERELVLSIPSVDTDDPDNVICAVRDFGHVTSFEEVKDVLPVPQTK